MTKLAKLQLKEHVVRLRKAVDLRDPALSKIAKISGLVSKGEPVSMREVGENLGLSESAAEALLKGLGSEFDGGRNLVGLGLTQVPTNHTFELEGKRLYVWCAGDTLLFPMLLGVTARVKTFDPISHAEISMTVTPRTVRDIEPTEAVLSFPTWGDAEDVRGSLCNHSHWFASRETAGLYASKHRGVDVLTAGEVREVFRILELGEPSTGGKCSCG